MSDDQLKPLDYYFTIKEYGSDEQQEVLIFGGWKLKTELYNFRLNELVREGFRCVVYEPQDYLIGTGVPFGRTVEAAGIALADAKRRVATAKVRGVTTCIVVGASYGTIFAMEAAKNIPDIKKVILLSPFGDFHDHVQSWAKQRLRGKPTRSQSTTLEESGNILNKTGTVSNLLQLRGKRLLIMYSRRDTVVHTHATEKLIDLLAQNGIKTRVVTNSGNHVKGIFKHMVFNWKHILSFMRED